MKIKGNLSATSSVYKAENGRDIFEVTVTSRERDNQNGQKTTYWRVALYCRYFSVNPGSGYIEESVVHVGLSIPVITREAATNIGMALLVIAENAGSAENFETAMKGLSVTQHKVESP